MNKIRITAVRQTEYKDLMAKYENAIEHTCDVRIGQEWVSVDGSDRRVVTTGRFFKEKRGYLEMPVFIKE